MNLSIKCIKNTHYIFPNLDLQGSVSIDAQPVVRFINLTVSADLMRIQDSILMCEYLERVKLHPPTAL